MGSMPLIASLVSPVERVPHLPRAKNLDAAVQEVGEKQYRHFQDVQEDEMTKGLLLNVARPEPDAQIPALPPRSSLRASQLLHGLMLDFPPEKVVADDETHPQAIEDDPHASYLSSEEEMSVIADEYDESLVELDSEHDSSGGSRASSRCSHEDMARAVCFMFVGKPQLVEVSRARPSSFKRRSTDLSLRSRRHLSPLQLQSGDSRSSTPSNLRSEILPSTTTTSRPLQQSNPAALHSATSLAISMSSKHSFIKFDPFPGPSVQEIVISPRATESRPKTPTALAGAALRGGLRGVTRTLSRSRKKAPVPKLNVAVEPPSVQQEPSPNPSISTSVATSVSTTSPATPQENSDPGPVTYNDIMRSVIKAPPLPSPSPPSEAKLKQSKFLFGVSKRKMAKAG